MATAWLYVINDGSGTPNIVRTSDAGTTVTQVQPGEYVVTLPSCCFRPSLCWHAKQQRRHHYRDPRRQLGPVAQSGAGDHPVAAERAARELRFQSRRLPCRPPAVVAMGGRRAHRRRTVPPAPAVGARKNRSGLGRGPLTWHSIRSASR